MRLYHIIHKHCIIIQTDTTQINAKLAFTAHYAGGGCTTWLCVYSGHIAYKSHAKCHIIPRATLCTTTSLSRSRKHGYSFMCGTASLFKPTGCTHIEYIGMHCQVGAISKRPWVSWGWFVPLTSAY